VRTIVVFALALALTGLASACSEQEEAPAASEEMVAPGAAPAAPAAADDLAAEGEDEESLQLAEGLEDDEEPIPLDEMDQAMLETACFEGRQDACDRLGH
jgi:hypothetical protein